MSEKFTSFAALVSIDFLFALLLGVALFLLARSRPAAFAVMKRNFLAYFTNPTGYVFLCLFVLLTSLAAFWTEAFFNSNLANLDQLNSFIPAILLVFIPAISMSIWAEERRQGTDELLLTMPAGDFDVVIGKYLAAVAIFTVSLLFSQVCNFTVLLSLGNPDTGLVLGNYLGYWMVGLAMLSVGMVASFLTNNLTVGFVLGVLFNAPLVAAGWSEVFLGPTVAAYLRPWSIAAQLRDFEAGVISGASILFFGLLIVLMIYLSMVLIGRRHWTGGPQGNQMGWHFLARALALVLITGGLSVLASQFDWFRPDVTSERINSLSDETIELVSNLEAEYPVHIDAYVSRDLPEDYAQRRLDLRSRLRELDALGRKQIGYTIHEVDINDDAAYQAEKRYGIEPQTVTTQVRGAIAQKDIVFGIACRSGSEQVVTPFLGKGVPIEYELIRSIATVTETKRKKIGILATDANVLGGGSFMGPAEDQPLAEELRKQYDLVNVSPNSKIEGNFAALLAVQPSSLTPPQMKHFVDAVRRGIPTAIFEDPLPYTMNVPGTDQPKRGQGPLAAMQPPQEKGNLDSLWDLLSVRPEKRVSPAQAIDPFGGAAGREEIVIVWQDYNPHPSESDVYGITPEWVFITPDEVDNPFSTKSPITNGLQEVLFLFAGGINANNARQDLDITTLVQTRGNSGTIRYSDLFRRTPFGEIPVPRSEVEANRKPPTGKRYVLAAHLRGPAPKSGAADSEAATPDAATDEPGDASDEDGAKDKAPAKDRELNVVLVSDVDVLAPVFFQIRTVGDDDINPITRWQLDNVAFVLNVIDVLAADTDFVEIRKRRPKHRELEAVQAAVEVAKQSRREAREKAEEAEKKAIRDAEEKLAKLLEENDQRDPEFVSTWQLAVQRARDEVKRKQAIAERVRDEEYDDIDRAMALEIRSVQDRYKLWAVVLPPIPPLLIAVCVFFVRRSNEREGVQSDRLV
ncbi:MAG: ABC transporter permease [Planctomycetota bacterium]|nr:MAG: ABC transporter permease [Planctomycetota bacterium]REJ96851.1 MAG: ABC transporter permease [Planctomycetota bacterium]